ncbi:hypothetical protein [Nonomuraea sp. KM90]|uniref:hypothetical protein n=1 Tax=Nonomuraea sp. KM90 TaxID=3457428 RepID=UPI003FCDCD65
MKFRLVGTTEEAETAAALIATVMTLLEDSGPRARRGGGLQIQRYLEVRLTPPQPPASSDPPPRPQRHGSRPEPEITDRPDAIDLAEWS